MFLVHQTVIVTPFRTNMIIARLMGGLGNQMFQYAAGRRLAAAHGVELKLDDRFFRTQEKRSFQLDRLNTRATLASEGEIAAFFVKGRLGRIQRAISCAVRRRPVPRVMEERHFHFDSLVLQATDETYLDGYWQSEKYFADVADLLRDEFTLRAPPSPETIRLAAEIADATAVSIHVRRGDYIQETVTKEVHGVCGIDYFTAAVEAIRAQVASPHFFIFSDDPEWAQENLHFEPRMTFIARGGDDCDHEHLWLMSRCAHQIIANSSFSWWAAWLNPNPGKTIVAPRRWFASAPHDTRDLFPAAWQLL